MLTNKLQIRYISYHENQNKYRFQKIIRGKCFEKSFHTLEEALEYKKKYLAENINI